MTELHCPCKKVEHITDAIYHNHVISKCIIEHIVDCYPELVTECVVSVTGRIRDVLRAADANMLNKVLVELFSLDEIVDIFDADSILDGIGTETVISHFGNSLVHAMTNDDIASGINSDKKNSLDSFFLDTASNVEKATVMEALVDDAAVLKLCSALQMIKDLIHRGGFAVTDIYSKDEIKDELPPEDYWDMMTKEDRLEWLERC